jgi:hypothetical protein
MTYEPEHPDFVTSDPEEMEAPKLETMEALANLALGYSRHNYKYHNDMLDMEIRVVATFEPETPNGRSYHFNHMETDDDHTPDVLNVATVTETEIPPGGRALRDEIFTTYYILRSPDGLLMQSHVQGIQSIVVGRIEDLEERAQPLLEKNIAAHAEEAKLGLHGGVNQKQARELLSRITDLKPKVIVSDN